MNRPPLTFANTTVAALLVVVALVGLGQAIDAVAQAATKDAAAGVRAPSAAETKAIAEEGFIYGLRMVMNYAITYAYFVDRNSGQWKAPFNKILNEPRVFTYKDTAVPFGGWTD